MSVSEAGSMMEINALTNITTAQKLSVASIAMLRGQERISHDFEDELLSLYIESAYDYLDGPNGYLNGYSILQREYECYTDVLGLDGVFEIPVRPFTSTGDVVISYLDDDGLDYTDLGAANFLAVRGASEASYGRIRRPRGVFTWGTPGQSWNVNSRGYRLTFKAGHATPDEVPAPLKLAILMLAGHFYQNRETTFANSRVTAVSSKIQFGLESLCRSYRFYADHS